LRRAVAEFETFHREAKQAHNQVKLTAYTLALIYLRAEIQGDACAPARAAVDDFMDTWAHAAPAEDADSKANNKE